MSRPIFRPVNDLDSSSNGLSYLVERLKGKPLVGHVTLAKSERSELASLITAEVWGGMRLHETSLIPRNTYYSYRNS